MTNLFFFLFFRWTISNKAGKKGCFKFQTISLVQHIFKFMQKALKFCVVLIWRWGFDLSVTLPCNDALNVTLLYVLFWMPLHYLMIASSSWTYLSGWGKKKKKNIWTTAKTSSDRKHLTLGSAQHRNISVLQTVLHLCSIFLPAGGEVSMLSESGEVALNQ